MLATPLLVSPLSIFGRCLDSKPESCRSKQVRYQPSHPSPTNLATHLSHQLSHPSENYQNIYYVSELEVAEPKMLVVMVPYLVAG